MSNLIDDCRLAARIMEQRGIFSTVLIQAADALAAKDAEIKRLREALKQCKTHIAGFNIRSHDDARSALSESNNELQRIHRVARAALEATR